MPQVGGEFAGYRIQRLIGRGGMSVVYRAESARMGRVVALKVLASELAQDDGFRERFVRESKLAASLDHPNIVPIYDAGDAGGLLYIAMRYVTGGLKALLEHKGRLTVERTASVIAQIASALDAAHELGLVHRDVKPANVLISFGAGVEDQDHIYLADFGLMKHARSVGGLTGTGQFVGTLDYMSPEQIQGMPVDRRTDVYALGCILYECLTGAVPFDRDSDAAVMWAHLKEEPPSVRERSRAAPSAIDSVISTALSKSPDDRFPTCKALVAALRSEMSGETRTARSRATTGGAPTRPRGRPTPPVSNRTGGSASAAGDGGGQPADVGASAGDREAAPALDRPSAVIRHAPDGTSRGRGWTPMTLAGIAVLAVGVLGWYTFSRPGEESTGSRSRAGATTASGLDTASEGRRRLVFASDELGVSHIYSCALLEGLSCREGSTGSGVAQLTDASVPDEDPVSSRDGTIAFVRGEQPAEIYSMDDDGTGIARLTTNDVHEDDPSWSPDGKALAFTRGMPADIYVMSFPGGDERQLTDDLADDQDPAWSPDGSRLAFVRWHENDVALYVVSRSGSGEIRVTSDPATEMRHPTWSPSGEQITFTSDWTGNAEIYVVNVDGSGLTRVTNGAATDDVGPSWSPDGGSIAFVRVSGDRRSIYVVDASGSGPPRRLKSGLSGSFDPAWSSSQP
jgi:serine/threonine protein kinase